MSAARWSTVLSVILFAACSSKEAKEPKGSESGPLGPQCTPDCSAAACGDDGCGGSCGSCPEGTSCTNKACIGEAAPPSWSCSADFYGTDDGCDCQCGAYDPDCVDPAAEVYNCEDFTNPGCDVHGACQEVPCSCDGLECGADACGNDCGTCSEGECVEGKCLPSPPATWTCVATWYGRSDGCDCGCGALDPDCADASQSLYNCPGDILNPRCNAAGACEPSCSCEGALCGDDGCGNSCGSCAADQICSHFSCVQRPPDGWSCPPTDYNDGFACDCGCGGPDSDCALPGAFLVGCGDVAYANPVCSPTTYSCEPSCSCAGFNCGDDGCGNSCGTCAVGQECQRGICVTPVPPGFICSGYAYGDGQYCHCECGTDIDPDCVAGLPIWDCAEGMRCDHNVCVP